MMTGSEAIGAEAASSASPPPVAELATPPVFVPSETVQPVEAPSRADTGTDTDSGPQPASERASIQAVPEAASLRELVARVDTSATPTEELRCLAGAVYFEARGEPLAGQLAVAEVVMNRAASPRFPDGYCGVVYQRAQFSFVRGGTMPRIQRGSEAWKRARAIARIAHERLWKTEASDALYFHASYVRPSWSTRMQRLAAIKTHIFYR